MDDRLKENELLQTAHVMILICYTMLSGILIGEAVLLGWEPWALILIALGIVTAWVIHIRAKVSEYTRLWVYSLLMMATFFYYGTHPTSTYDISAVMAAVITLYTMTGVAKLILLCQVTFFITYAYDIIGMIRSGFVFTPLDVTRTLLHAALVIMVGWIARIIIDRWGRVLRRAGQEIAAEKESTEHLNDFLANVSHEIRTPVNAVLGFTAVCLEKEVDSDVRRSMESVREAGERINDQISDILDYSEIYRKSLKKSSEDYTLPSVVYDVTSRLKGLLREGCELIIDIDPGVYAVLHSDSSKIKKILHHLMENALKYTLEGGIYVHIYAIEEVYGANLCLEVEDTGIGMEEKDEHRSLLGFYQGDSSRTRRGGGLGLGLAIVRGFVSSLGGFMTIKSRKGEGTLVRVSIPQEVKDTGKCMTIPERESLRLIAFVRFGKFKSPDVREYYDRLMKSLVSGLEVSIHRVESIGELHRLCDSIEPTHLLVGKEEYEENSGFMEELARKAVVVVAAGEGFAPPANSSIVLMPKPVSTFSVVEILNIKPEHSKEEKKPLRLKGIRALVVDDEPMNLSVAKGILSRYGMDIDTAGSGREAIDSCSATDYDIVFMDHMMPEMDGIETAEMIWKKSGPSGKKPAIVALTANTISTAKELFISRGFDGFIAKPIEIHELERVLKKVLPEEPRSPYEGDSGIAKTAAIEGKFSFYEAEESLSSGESGGEHNYLAAAGVEAEKGISYCQGDREFYRSLLRQYMDVSEDKLKKIRASFESKDWKDYEIYVHALKSTSKMIGALGLSEKARMLEKKASEGGEIAEADNVSLLEDYEKVVEAIKKDLATAEGPVFEFGAGSGDGGAAESGESLEDDCIFEFAAENADGGGNDSLT